MQAILEAHTPPGGRLGNGHKGLFDTVNNSLHFQLGLALASVGTICSLVAQHMYALPPYAFLANDFTTMAALYTHHQYIAGFIMCGAFAHGAIFFIRDYDPEQNKGNVLARMLEHKEAIISHLSWASLFLGFHTLGLYVHNDVMQAFGTPEKQILDTLKEVDLDSLKEEFKTAATLDLNMTNDNFSYKENNGKCPYYLINKLNN